MGAAMGCDGSPGDGERSGSCQLAQGLNVVANIVHDNRSAEIEDSVYVVLSDGPELPADCEATVTFVGGSRRIALQRTSPGTYQVGDDPIDLVPGRDYTVEVDIGSDGTTDAEGSVHLANITEFRHTDSRPGSVTVAWADAGAPTTTVYYVQASDQSDFLFPDNFATGFTTDRSITFGGSSPNNYFEVAQGTTCYARIQAFNEAAFDVPGRIESWQYPNEPILSYR
jgi:hypothetical protein